jgi:hypothetical protein
MRAWLGILAVVPLVAVALLLHYSAPVPQSAEGHDSPLVAARGVTVEEIAADGTVLQLRIGEISPSEGRIGFFRSPLLRGVELRDVEVIRNGRLVEKIDVVSLAGVSALRRLPESLRGDVVATQMEQLAWLAGSSRG